MAKYHLFTKKKQIYNNIIKKREEEKSLKYDNNKEMNPKNRYYRHLLGIVIALGYIHKIQYIRGDGDGITKTQIRLDQNRHVWTNRDNRQWKRVDIIDGAISSFLTYD